MNCVFCEKKFTKMNDCFVTLFGKMLCMDCFESLISNYGRIVYDVFNPNPEDFGFLKEKE
jgi:hypothetical protein